LDGNFEQKHLRHAGSGDQPGPVDQTFFLDPQEVLQAKEHVEECRTRSNSRQSNGDTTLPGLFMANYIYTGCGERFLAAGEQNTKAETSVYDDTGLMALVCPHDRPLFMVTLKDRGEKQYNAIALLHQLFKELPDTWRVGVLYDIACQVHYSFVKVCNFILLVQIPPVLIFD
jgi:Kyakuja-Dileera-Zisupton transposase